ncbi:MAG: hypothetical protein ACK55Z_16560 [bacterium]
MCFKFAGKQYIFNSIDIAKGSHNDQRFLAINPSGYLPMIEVDPSNKLIGANHILQMYLIQNNN